MCFSEPARSSWPALSPGAAARLSSCYGLSIEELKPIPPACCRAPGSSKGTIGSITGDRVEVETGERNPRYLSIEAGGDEALGLHIGGAVEILVNDRDEIVAYQRPAETPPTKVLRGALGKPAVQPPEGASHDPS